jgi:hypothetical protein
MDRLMAYSKEAFIYYKQENKELPPIYPVGVDEKGIIFSHKDFDPEKAEQEVLNAMGDDYINLEHKSEE